MKTSALLCVCLCLATSNLLADDWPQFLGPRRNGTSSETGLLTNFPAPGPRVVWEKAVGTGYSAPSVLGGQLVLHSRIGSEEVVESFETGTGKPGWRYAYPSSFTDPYGYNNGPRCSPLLTSNRCYTFGAEGKLLCLNRSTGKLVWQRDTASDWNIPSAFFGVGSTPLLEGDKLIVMLGAQTNAGVVAFDAATGRTVWENVGQTNWSGALTIGWRAERPYEWRGEEKQASYSSPIAATIHGKRHVFCFMRQGLVSLDPANGEVRFSRWFQAMVDESVNAMVPVVEGDSVLVSAAYYRVGAVLLKVSPDGRSYQEVWRNPKHPLDSSDRNPETGRWNAPTLEIHWSTPLLHNGYLYAFSGRNEPDATFRCVEFKTGKLMWSRDERWRGHPAPGAKAQPNVFGRGAAILADGKIWALGEGGLLGLFEPDPKECREVARWQVPALSYPCWAAPVLADKKLYLRGENRLLCLDVSAAASPSK